MKKEDYELLETALLPIAHLPSSYSSCFKVTLFPRISQTDVDVATSMLKIQGFGVQESQSRVYMHGKMKHYRHLQITKNKVHR